MGGLETTEQAAVRLRNARGLQLWRLLVSWWAAGARPVSMWRERVAQWRAAFDAVRFRPGESGAERARRHFYALTGA